MIFRLQEKLEDTKKSRDQEIEYLQKLPFRTSKDQEMLNKLSLEREFQRRAEEHKEDEEEDDATLMERAEKRERVVNLQQDLDRNLKRIEQKKNFDEYVNTTGVKFVEEQSEKLKTLRINDNNESERKIAFEPKKTQVCFMTATLKNCFLNCFFRTKKSKSLKEF